jgi:hypothetical protein
MRKVILLFFLIPFTSVYSQSAWEPMFLTVSGNHIVDGVEGWFQPGECNGAPVVFIRFVNTNNSSVRVTWYDGIFTQALEWDKKMKPEDIKSLTVPGQSDQFGQCGTNPLLIITLADFNLGASDFKRYTAQEFNVTFE